MLKDSVNTLSGQAGACNRIQLWWSRGFMYQSGLLKRWNNMDSKLVIHKTLGEGMIKKIEADYVTVKFPTKEMMFKIGTFDRYFKFDNVQINIACKEFEKIESLRNMYERLDNAISEAHYKEALVICKSIINDNGEDIKAWSYRALCDFELKDFKNAKRICSHFLENETLKANSPERVQLRKIVKFIDSIEQRSGKDFVYQSKGAYKSHCYNCKHEIDENMPKCDVCGWYICINCGRCGCHYKRDI